MHAKTNLTHGVFLAAILVWAVAIAGESAATPVTDIIVPEVLYRPRPEMTAGVASPVLSLDGIWKHRPAGRVFPEKPDATWKDIDLPWTIMGQDTDYARSFTVPADWKGQRVILRCEAVDGASRIVVNGKETEPHPYMFVPFERDISDAVTAGSEAQIAIRVGPQFHPLWPHGGISKHISLHALPPVHLERFHVATSFDAAFKDATLSVTVKVANRSPAGARTEVSLVLTDAAGQPVPMGPNNDQNKLAFANLAAGARAEQVLEVPIAAPKHWDTEHPYLYTLTAQVSVEGRPVERVSRRVGFRQFDFVDNVLRLNGNIIRLHGTMLFPTYAGRGGFTLPDDKARDLVRQFRDANCNVLRLVPAPSQATVEACDELGILAMPGPTFHQWTGGIEKAPIASQVLAELIEAYRSHPCVFAWELANESNRWPGIEVLAKTVLRLDPSRPRIATRDNGPIELLGLFSEHYPNSKIRTATFNPPATPPDWTRTPPKLNQRQVLYTEYNHVRCYSLAEDRADPGLRDHWGWGLVNHWERCYRDPKILGGMVFCGVDYWDPKENLPCGIIDRWLRPKPEYWHMRKVHSPVRIFTTTLKRPEAGQALRIEVHNRHDFSDLSEVAITWKAGGKSGKVSAKAAPHQPGLIEIADPILATAKELELSFTSARGFVLDEYRLSIGEVPVIAAKTPVGTASLESDPSVWRVKAGKVAWEFDRKTGMITRGTINGESVVTGGPWAVCGQELTTWQAQKVDAKQDGSAVVVTLNGTFSNGKTGKNLVALDGTLECRIAGDGNLAIKYDWVSATQIGDQNYPVAEIGLALNLTRAMDALTWKRRGLWTVYPDDHIGRLEGRAPAFRDPNGKADDPLQKPAWPFSLEQTMAGTADFRSTKHALDWACLADAKGTGLRLASDGTRHARAMVVKDAIHLLDLHHSGAGNYNFNREFEDCAFIDKGGRITGSTGWSLVDTTGPAKP